MNWSILFWVIFTSKKQGGWFRKRLQISLTHVHAICKIWSICKIWEVFRVDVWKMLFCKDIFWVISFFQKKYLKYVLGKLTLLLWTFHSRFWRKKDQFLLVTIRQFKDNCPRGLTLTLTLILNVTLTGSNFPPWQLSGHSIHHVLFLRKCWKQGLSCLHRI